MEAAGLILGVVPLIIESQRKILSATSLLKRYTGIHEETERLNDAIENFEQIQPELEHLTSLLSLDGGLTLDDEERQLADRVLGRSTALSNIVVQRLRNIEELERRRGHGTLRLDRRSRTAVQELAVEVNRIVTDLRDDIEILKTLVQGSISRDRLTTVEDDVLPFQQALNGSDVYRKSNSVPSGLAPVQFEEIFPDAPLPNQNGYQEDPEEEDDGADAANWSTAEFYSSEKQEEVETAIDDSSSIISLIAGARSITASYEDRLPHRCNDRHQKTVYEVFIYDEGGHPHKAKCLLDTGASLDCISLQMACKLKLKKRLKRLRTPVEFKIGSGELLAASFVVESFWAFVSKPMDCYERPLYVLEGFPHDMALSEQTIFQEDFLLANLEISPSGMSTTQEGFERMLPLALPKRKVPPEPDNTAEENARQRELDFENLRRQAAEKKKQTAKKRGKEQKEDADA